MAKNQRARRASLTAERLEDRDVPSVSLVDVRTIDGTDNNPNFPNQGAAESVQIRFGYGDDFPGDGTGDTIITSPNPRVVSNAVLDQDVSIPSGNHLTDWAFQWGQWVTHDMDLTRNGPGFGVANIPIEEANDPFGQGNFIPFNRSEFTRPNPSDPRREVINSITSYIDASHVYGSDPVRAAALRLGDGTGKLRTSDGNLLPFWDPASGLPNATPPQGVTTPLFLAGDVRANEQVNLTAVHTLFVREHNRICDRIAGLIANGTLPGMTDDQIFEVARRLVGAEQQIITYEEYLPAILGYDLTVNPNAYSYGPGTDADNDGLFAGNVEGDVTNSFAHAAFRFGHSQINEATLLVNFVNQVVGSLAIDDAFFNPSFLANNPGNLGLTLKGLAFQTGQEVDVHLVDGIRNNLFGNVGGGGIDLGALDIQRGRDHGLPDFNNLRNAYRAGTAYTSFADFAARNPKAAAAGIVAQLEALYPTDPLNPANTGINAIDAFVGMLAEDHLPGSNVGPVLNSIIRNQFLRLMDGDRFFYTGDAFLQLPEVKAILNIDDVSLANVISWNTGATDLQENVFFDRSVLFFQAPEGGSNISVRTAGNAVSIIDNQTGQLIASRLLNTVERIVLVGSAASADVFNLFIAGANGRIEDGVVAFGGGSAGDRLNVFGRPNHDTFTVTDSSFTTGSVTGLRRGGDNPAENAITLAVSGRDVDVNGNKIFSSGFETTRLVTLGGNDTIFDPDMLAIVFALWDTLSDD